MQTSSQASSDKPGERAALARPAASLHMLAYVACPIKQVVRDYFDALAARHRKATGEALSCHIPMGCHEDDPYEDLIKAKTIEELPGVTASVGFGDFMTPSFFKRFVSKGRFQSANRGQVHPAFASSGLLDPEGWYTPYSVWAHVLVVDLKNLGGLPVPSRWSDLLDPCYAGHIVSDGAHHQRFAQIVLLHYYRHFGEAGVVQLVKNIRETAHPAEMVKTAGTPASKGASIYIMPWSFAYARRWPQHMRLVWPEEGALASPMYAWVKADAPAAVRMVGEALVSEKLGRACAQAGFPSLNPNVDNHLPSDASFAWLGWDYVRTHDTQQLGEVTSDIAETAWLAKGA
jgi:ABC-type Fe3+ transport system substrate-binding protein